MLASRKKRLLGLFFDGFICLPLLLVLRGGFGNEIKVFPGMVSSMLWILVFFCLNCYMLVKHGQTIGKWLVGTRIVAQKDEQCGVYRVYVLRSLLINFIEMVPVLGALFGILDGLFIFRKERRCLHDLIAGTKVIDIEKRTSILEIVCLGIIGSNLITLCLALINVYFRMPLPGGPLLALINGCLSSLGVSTVLGGYFYLLFGPSPIVSSLIVYLWQVVLIVTSFGLLSGRMLFQTLFVQLIQVHIVLVIVWIFMASVNGLLSFSFWNIYFLGGNLVVAMMYFVLLSKQRLSIGSLLSKFGILVLALLVFVFIDYFFAYENESFVIEGSLNQNVQAGTLWSSGPRKLTFATDSGGLIEVSVMPDETADMFIWKERDKAKIFYRKGLLSQRKIYYAYEFE